MEYLDIYDSNKKFLRTSTREQVHKEGLWHNTVHCWLYDSYGNIYFQIRADNNKLYTTASGHVSAGETIKEAFGREIREEIGIDINYQNAKLVDIVIWEMDKIKKDGTRFFDRAFANVYVLDFVDSVNDFKFDLEEVSGLVKVKATDALNLFTQNSGEIVGDIITKNEGTNTVLRRNIKFEEFLVNEHETAIGKYGDILNKVIGLTTNS